MTCMHTPAHLLWAISSGKDVQQEHVPSALLEQPFHHRYDTLDTGPTTPHSRRVPEDRWMCTCTDLVRGEGVVASNSCAGRTCMHLCNHRTACKLVASQRIRGARGRRG